MAVLLLPLNATWAQKPDQKEEVGVVEKSGDDSHRSADAVAKVEGDRLEGSGEGIIEVDTVGDGKLRVFKIQKGKPDVVLEVKTGDSAVAVKADSMKRAIDKLKEHVKVLVKEIDLLPTGRRREEKPSNVSFRRLERPSGPRLARLEGRTRPPGSCSSAVC